MLTRNAQVVLALLATRQDEGSMTEQEIKEASNLSPTGLDAGLNELEDRGLIEGGHRHGVLRYWITESGRQVAVE